MPERSSDAWLERSAAIACRINNALMAKRMLQKELAETLGIKPQQVSKILRGNVNLTLETISRLEAALGISLLEVSAHEFKGVGGGRAKRTRRGQAPVKNIAG